LPACTGPSVQSPVRGWGVMKMKSSKKFKSRVYVTSKGTRVHVVVERVLYTQSAKAD
jgi:hypothetical protein